MKKGFNILLCRAISDMISSYMGQI
ncbi:hypothetical protein IL54_3963 [Sphingobium sp. ba1]|nr:hypothetical protein IL54_3963 [Sphingobium sp. ba1]